METSLMVELHIFLTAIYGGLIAGLIYDMYKVMRYLFKPRKLMTYIGDLLFWTIMTSVFFYTLIKNNWGEIRGYIVFGFLLGIFIYHKIFSKFIYPLCLKGGIVIGKTIKGVVDIIIYPFKILKSKSSPKLKKIKKIPIEIIRQTKKYKKIFKQKI